jgi:hypothetical protein
MAGYAFFYALSDLAVTFPGKIEKIQELAKLLIIHEVYDDLGLQAEDCRQLSSFPPPEPSPSEGGRCEKIDLTLFHVIPAKAGIQRFQGFTN